MHLRPLLPAAAVSVDPDAVPSGRRTADRAADVADLGEWQTHQAALFGAFGTLVHSSIGPTWGVSGVMLPVHS
jgi:hypothetical protein